MACRSRASGGCVYKRCEGENGLAYYVSGTRGRAFERKGEDEACGDGRCDGAGKGADS